MMKNRIYLSPPDAGDNEKRLLSDAFESNWIAPLGPNVDQFDKEMAAYIGVTSAAALSSGTAALHLALKILGVSEGDKVLCSSLTFTASANAILYEKAVPVFIDSDPSTYNLDATLLEVSIKKYKPKALIAVDLYGQSCVYDTISEICKKYDIFLIEDSAEALGSSYKGGKCGSFGDIAIFSFNGNKIITTSGGGMILSNNEDYINKAKFLSTQAREPELHYEHRELGYNYRLSNLLAALGRGQLKTIDEKVRKRRDIFKRYFNALSHIEGIEFMPEAPGCRSNRWLTVLTIDPAITGITRTDIIRVLEAENIESRPIWKPMHLQPLYESCDYVHHNGTDHSKHLFDAGLCLPSGSSLTENDQDRIIDIIHNQMK